MMSRFFTFFYLYLEAFSEDFLSAAIAAINIWFSGDFRDSLMYIGSQIHEVKFLKVDYGISKMCS